ncbi:hypothetical protein JP0100_04580 [Helicobacter pylori]|nr:hypothetical protein JP0100_04580 [Helicobacter pylori]
MQTIHIGVLSASDRASKGIYEDLSGKAIQEGLSEYLLNPLEFHYEIVADERDLIVCAYSDSIAPERWY